MWRQKQKWTGMALVAVKLKKYAPFKLIIHRGLIARYSIWSWNHLNTDCICETVMLCTNIVNVSCIEQSAFLSILNLIIISWVKWQLCTKETSSNKNLWYTAYCNFHKCFHNQIQSSLPPSGWPVTHRICY